MLLKLRSISLLILSILCISNANAALVVGSDLLKDVLEPVITKYGEAEDIEFTFEMTGTALSMGKIRNEEADLAIIADPEEEDLDIIGYNSIPFAYFASVAITNTDNPIKHISEQQLAGIFGNDVQPKINRWNDLNLSGTWGSMSIQPVSISNRSSIGFELLKYKTMPNSSIDTNVTILDDPIKIIEKVVSNRNGIAIVPMIKPIYDVNILSVSGTKSDGSEYTYAPTLENISYGEYPLRLKFTILYKSDLKYLYLPLLKKLMDNSMAEMLLESNLAPLPERDRKRIILELDIN